jgi:hypothetical protein
MSRQISVDRQYLYYVDGPNELKLSVEWSAVAKTEDMPNDFEISARDLTAWTKPAGEPIDPARRERLLDEIAEYYSRGPVADIIGPGGALLRGQSKYRFYLHIPPKPSCYYEVGRFLSIPMAPPVPGTREWSKKYILDFSGITEWTDPRTPLEPEYLNAIARRIVAKEKIGAIGLPAPLRP